MHNIMIVTHRTAEATLIEKAIRQSGLYGAAHFEKSIDGARNHLRGSAVSFAIIDLDTVGELAQPFVSELRSHSGQMHFPVLVIARSDHAQIVSACLASGGCVVVSKRSDFMQFLAELKNAIWTTIHGETALAPIV